MRDTLSIMIQNLSEPVSIRDVKHEYSLFIKQNNDKVTPYQVINTTLFRTISEPLSNYNNLKVVKVIIETCIDAIPDIGNMELYDDGVGVTSQILLFHFKRGANLLHVACVQRNLPVVKYLVENAGAHPNTVNCTGSTPLTFACFYGDFEAVKYLVGLNGVQHTKAEPKCIVDVNWMNNTGLTPLNGAAFMGFTDIVEYLVNEGGADVNGSSKTLNLACRYNYVYMAEFLAKHDGLISDECLEFPLEFCFDVSFNSRNWKAFEQHNIIVKMILTKPILFSNLTKVGICIEKKSWEQLVTWAICTHRADTLLKLLNHCHDKDKKPFDVNDTIVDQDMIMCNKPSSFLGLAVYINDVNCVKVLLDHGAELCVVHINHMCKPHNVIHIATDNDNQEMVSLLSQHFKLAPPSDSLALSQSKK